VSQALVTQGELHETLEELVLRNCYLISDEGLRLINEKCSSLRHLNVTNCKVCTGNSRLLLTGERRTSPT
jgi:hypothetical protein